MADELTINLAVLSSVTAPVQVAAAGIATYSIVADEVTYSSWDTGRVSVQWSNQAIPETWVDYSSANDLVGSSSSTLGVRSVSVTGARWVRFRTSSADTNADPVAVISVDLQ